MQQYRTKLFAFLSNLLPCIILLSVFSAALWANSAIAGFAAVDAAMANALAREKISGMSLAIYDAQGRQVFLKNYGDFSPDKRVAIASASKLVSGLTLLRLIDQGKLSLDSTTGQILDWTGEKAHINLRQLLSFTSGLQIKNRCTSSVFSTLEKCVDKIYRADSVAKPGEEFNYSSANLAVAGRMAEVVTGQAWNTIFQTQIAQPLGLPGDLRYYAAPRAKLNPDNPLVAGGLQMSMNDYAKILQLVFDRGEYNGRQLISRELMDAQARNPYPNSRIGKTPSPIANMRYGLTAWLECNTPDTGCEKISSPGAFGFTPWVDREHGYYAILGMQFGVMAHQGFGVKLEQELQPLILKALAE